MSATHFHTAGKVNVGIDLGSLSTVHTRTGINKEVFVTIRWDGCSKLEMGVEQALYLRKLLSEALEGK